MDQMTFPELRDKLASLYTEGKYANALELVEQHAGHFPDETARITFWRMCLLSLAGRASDVISTFQQGLDSELWWMEQLFTDPDLDAVRELPDFKRLAAVSQQKYEEARTRNERDQAILLPEAPSSGLYPLLITLHGRNAKKEADLKHWEVARQRGWCYPLSPPRRFSPAPIAGMILCRASQICSFTTNKSHRTIQSIRNVSSWPAFPRAAAWPFTQP
jgi:hypothetical protein